MIFNKIIITFTKTKPFRYVKLWYIEYGREFLFGEDVIKSGNLVQEIDPISDKITNDTMTVEIMDKNNLSAGILSLLDGGLISLYNYRR